MTDHKKRGGAAATAHAPKALHSAQNAQSRSVHRRSMVIVRASGPDGAFTVRGQTAKALRALVKAGKAGVTAQEAAGWAYRLAAYVHQLRTAHGLAIEMQREPHSGGWHGRYVLHSPVEVLEVTS